jgi:hypothetical protein
MLIVTVACAVVVAACGTDPETRGHAATEREVDGTLPPPPFALDDTTRLMGIDDQTLFAATKSAAGTYDFARAAWRRLPGPPLPAIGLAQVGSTVLIIGLTCRDRCPEGKRARLAGTTLDLGAPDRWSEPTVLDLPAVLPEDVGVTDLGVASGLRIIDILRRAYVIDADLGLTELGAPDGIPWSGCAAGELVWEVAPNRAMTDAERAAALAPRIGRGGNAHIVARDPRRGSWFVAPGSDTAALPAPPGATDETGNLGAPGFLAATAISRSCGTRGPILATASETLEWTGRAWTVHPSAPTVPFGLTTSASTRSGKLAALGEPGDVAVLAAGAWTTRTVCGPEQPAGSAPPAADRLASSAIVAVGERLVVLGTRAHDPTNARLCVLPA